MNILSVFDNRENLFIEVDKKYLKLLQPAKKGSGKIISKLLVEPVAGLSDEEISKLLIDVINSYNITFNSITAIISRERVITRYMKFPSVDNAEIGDMVAFEVAKQTPYSQDDIVSDYKVMEVDSQGYSKVSMVFSPKSEILRINNILGALAGRLNRIYFTSEAIAGWVKMLSLDISDKDCLCVINIDSGTTEIAVFAGAGLCFSRAISTGAEDIIQAGEQPNPLRIRLAKEIEQSITLYKKEKDASLGDIAKIILTGANSCLNNFADFLHAAIGISPEGIDQLSIMQLSDNALSGPGVPEYASVCALCGSLFVDAGIDLLPQEQKGKNKKSLFVRKAIIIFAFCAFIFFGFFGTVFFKIHQRENTLRKLEAMYSQVENISAQTEAKLKSLRSIKGYLAEGDSSLDVIYNLYALVPAGMVLLDFDYDDISKTVRFSGRARRMSDVFSLVSVLEESKIFSNVQTQSVVQRRIKEGAAVDFQIRCNFKKVS